MTTPKRPGRLRAVLNGKGFDTLREFLSQRGRFLKISGLPLGATAFLFSRLSLPSKVVFVSPDPKTASKLKAGLRFFGPHTVKLFPSPETPPFASIYPDPEVGAQRVATLFALLEPNPLLVVTSVPALMQRTLPPQVLKEHYEYLLRGEEIPREKLIKRLIMLGYEKTGLVQHPGEFALRGGVLDIFSPYFENPLRVDFFGDQIESLKLFDPQNQRSIKDIEEAVILPARELILPQDKNHLLEEILDRAERYKTPPDKREAYLRAVETGYIMEPEPLWLPLLYQKTASLLDYISPEDLVVLVEPEDLADQIQLYSQKIETGWRRAQESKRILVEPQESFLTRQEISKRLKDHPFALEVRSLPVQGDIVFEVKDHDFHIKDLAHEPKKALEKGLAYLREMLEKGEHVVIATAQERSAEYLKATLSRKLSSVEDIPVCLAPYHKQIPPEPLEICIGLLPQGFFWPSLGLVVIPEHELFGTKRPLLTRKRTSRDTFIQFEDLKPGDYVVHREHGIGRYQGLVSLNVGGLPGEFLLLEYHGGDKLYLPVDRLSVLHKYIGLEGKPPRLDRLGGKNFEARKQKVKKAIQEVAQEILTLYAARKVQKGHAFSPPSTLLRQVEASFPYEETPEQALAIEETLTDMQKAYPMDRLICGDVGYGKTEVAIRAAALAVENGKQVAVLVPTTVLAEQHYQTFSQRLAPLGIKVGVLSRLKTNAVQKESLKKLARGEIDIIIGTHRLLSPDVHFKDLGLLIIDEEHRFGVRHKERLKQLRKNVDVLALSATPIPRTLQLSLLGLRDLSVITSPPQDRQPVKTYLAKFSPEVIKEAVERELARGGQIFFVHNRIQGIYALADWLRRLVPKARIEVAHGRTPPSLLEKIMARFVRHEIDVLVSTTIIESGLDIPSANTIIINRADRLGLAEIYQLRGRVGRSPIQAYAYLLVPSLTNLSEEAERRLKALMQFSELGSGFKLAMSDLQIRGAGNLLGTVQSGHIAAVGYDLYLEILQRTIEELQGKEITEEIEPEVNLKVAAFFPDSYVPDVEQRLHLYRKLALAQDLNALEAFRLELLDRFGQLPPEAINLIDLSLIKIYLRALGIQKLDRRGQEVIFSFPPSQGLKKALPKKLARRYKHLRCTKEGKIYVRFHQDLQLSEIIALLEEWLKSD